MYATVTMPATPTSTNSVRPIADRTRRATATTRKSSPISSESKPAGIMIAAGVAIMTAATVLQTTAARHPRNRGPPTHRAAHTTAAHNRAYAARTYVKYRLSAAIIEPSSVLEVRNTSSQARIRCDPSGYTASVGGCNETRAASWWRKA
ncbi:hypothetical protein ACFQ1I_19720 [Kitasatospora arboriphila]